ncbi:hypothetical protein F0U61_40240 [Archangium violaceum]|uniref:hypothetical protein n=1 Tax=Archangium violaceum TaxID=83451 RepID=UPI002B2C901F|nr:hypothetical protein F0U61_40240 [Archangium violaceum]
MSTRLMGLWPRSSRQPSLLVLLLLTGCATGGPAGRPGHYAQATDSATSGCLRNPACYTTPPGEEAIIPWLSRATSAVRATTTVAMMLQEADIKIIERALTDCARAANEQVNQEDEELRGQEPTREQCKKVVRREGTREVTRAMELGTKKHALALDCARKVFAERFSENVRVEPTYQKDPNTGQWRWINPEQVEEWLQLGLTSKLWGALVPDIVLHASGNPNQAQRVYDFKFPCPADNAPSWGAYAKGHPHHPKNQEKMYADALLGGKSKPKPITPKGAQ